MKYRMRSLTDEPRTREEIESFGWIIDKVLDDGSLSAHVEPKGEVGYIGGVWQIVQEVKS
jgi:hypothetical protein